MDLGFKTNIERRADKKGQKMDGNIYCPATEADRKDTVCPLRDRYFLSGSGGDFVPQARKSSLWIADLAFPDYEFRREIFLAMSWREIIHGSNFAGLTSPKEFAKGRNVIPHHTAGRYGYGVRPAPQTVTWIARMNWLASSIIAVLASAQFQSFMRSVFKWGGGILVTKGYIHENDLLQALGAFSTLYGLVMSGVAHSELGTAATGTAAGPAQKAGG